MPAFDAKKFLFRHAVALLVTYRFRDDEPHAKRRLAVYSCAVIVIDDTPCLLTAGHCISEIERLIDSENITNIGCAIGDIFGLEAKSSIPIPFDIENSYRFHVDDDEDELDFGVILLTPHYVRLLGKNGIVGIFEENWARQQTLSFDAYVILGFPKALTETELTEGDRALVTPFLLRVNPPDTDLHPDYVSSRRFVGTIADDLDISSIEGMSGGPILGFNKSKPNTYWIVAIQSTWIASKRLVYGCPLPRIGRHLSEGLRAARASLEDSNGDDSDESPIGNATG